MTNEIELGLVMARFGLTPKEQKMAAELAYNHRNVRMYRSRNKSITLSRDAMHSSCRETFWLRLPDTEEDRKEYRRGFLVPHQRPNDQAMRPETAKCQ